MTKEYSTLNEIYLYGLTKEDKNYKIALSKNHMISFHNIYFILSLRLFKTKTEKCCQNY